MPPDSPSLACLCMYNTFPSDTHVTPFLKILPMGLISDIACIYIANMFKGLRLQSLLKLSYIKDTLAFFHVNTLTLREKAVSS